jgi:hypothetical protein
MEPRGRGCCRPPGQYDRLNTVHPEDVTERIQEGVMMGAGPRGQAAAEVGRAYTKRTMPW